MLLKAIVHLELGDFSSRIVEEQEEIEGGGGELDRANIYDMLVGK